MIAEQIPCQTTLSLYLAGDYTDKISFHYDRIKVSVLSSKAVEVSEAFLNKQLSNSKYSKLSFLDFRAFDFLLRKRREQDLTYWTEAEYKEYKKIILDGVKSATLPPPIILRDLEGKYVLFSGEARLLAYKVLGITPCVKVIDIDEILISDNATN